MEALDFDEKATAEKRLELFNVLFEFRKKYPTIEIIADDSNYNIITVYIPPSLLKS